MKMNDDGSASFEIQIVSRSGKLEGTLIGTLSGLGFV
jgi:hypothetical protein